MSGVEGFPSSEEEEQAMQDALATLLEGWESTNAAWEIDEKVDEIRRTLGEKFPAWLVEQAVQEFHALNRGDQQEK